MGDQTAFQGYWRTYGGAWHLLRSMYFWLALALSVVTDRLWEPGAPAWVDLTLAIAPNLLGFALVGMAIMLTFSEGKFLAAIRQKGKEDSLYMMVMASFFHFALVLSVALILAYIGRPDWLPPFAARGLSFIGCFASLYGVLLVLATVSSIWHMARVYNNA